MPEAAPHDSKMEPTKEFAPPILKLLEQLDNLSHGVVAILFILMAVTVLIHTCFIFARQLPLIAAVGHTRQEVAADVGATQKPTEDLARQAEPTSGTNLEDPFYRVSLEILSSILFAVIILELLRTIITYLQTHDILAIMQEFLVVGIISSVRKILLVGAEASLSGSSGITFIQEATGVLLNIGGILLLIVGLVLLRRGYTKKDGSG